MPNPITAAKGNGDLFSGEAGLAGVFILDKRHSSERISQGRTFVSWFSDTHPKDDNMASSYSISQKNKMRGGFDTPEKIKDLLESNSTWPAETYTIVETSTDLSPGALNRHWGIAIKRADGTVRLVRGGRA
jgi:hypothetical protein